MSRFPDGRAGRRPMRLPPRLILAAVVAGVALLGYMFNRSVNPLTGRGQHVALSVPQEIALGLQSAPEMARQFGGLHPDDAARETVKAVGRELVASLPPSVRDLYPFDFHLLADDRTVNAFALPGGQIFITAALLSRLDTRGELAGVLGHEIGHVLGRHSAAQMAKGQLIQGLVGAVGVAAADGAGGQYTAQQIAGVVANMATLKYGREDELEADEFGLSFMHAAGYDPRSLGRVMEILREASGGSQGPEFMSTHPDPGNRIERIESRIRELFPSGVPAGLRP